jgi:hypothetical protein
MSQKRSEPPSASIEFFKGDMISLKRKRNAKRFCNDTNSCLQNKAAFSDLNNPLQTSKIPLNTRTRTYDLF